MSAGCQCAQCGIKPKGFLGFLSAAALVSTPAPASAPGAVNPTAILAQICPSGVGKGSCPSPNAANYTSFLEAAISSRFLPAYTTATGASNANACAGVSTNSETNALSIGKTAASTGLTIAGTSLSIAGAATAAIPIVGAIVGAITSVISIIVGHHSAAVKEQDQLLCQAVPATNSVLQQIDAALASGSLTPAQAEAQYSSFLSQFTSEMKSDPSYKQGDAMNGYLIAFQCVIAARNQDLQNGVLTGGAPGPWTQTAASSGIAGAASSALDSVESLFGISPSASASGSTNWVPWAIAAGLAALFLL